MSVRWSTVRTSLAAAGFVGVLLAGASAGAATPAPATTVASVPAEASTADGLVVRAEQRDVYISGFPALVEVVVRNPTDQPRTFPDLARRPWLVRFRVELDGRRSERATTAPSPDPGGVWTLAPRGERRVLLEIPASAALKGAGTLALVVGEDATAVTLPTRPVAFRAAQPVAGQPLVDAGLRRTHGVDLPWVQAVPGGFDVHLLHFSPKRPAVAERDVFLARVTDKPDVQLSLARPQDAASRWIYWPASGGRFFVARLDGLALEASPRAVAVPYPGAVPLARGLTDGEGGLAVPLWIPSPKGSSGQVVMLCVDRRGGAIVRRVGDLPERPSVVETALDGAGQALLVLGHAEALDLYRVDPSLPPEIPAKGTRLVRMQSGESIAGATVDVLPDTPERAGGLVVIGLTSRVAGEVARLGRIRAFDLNGKLVHTGEEAAWKVPGVVRTLATRGTGPWTAYSLDAKGGYWLTDAGGAPVRAAGPGAFWEGDGGAYLVRTLGGPRVVSDAPVARAR